MITKHIWDGANIVMETSNYWNTEKFMRGIGGSLIAKIDSGGKKRYLHNAHGDVAQTIDFINDVTPLLKTDAFGKGSVIDEFGYAGEYEDAETGRFISEDPIRDGRNWYVYGYDNTGHHGEEITKQE